MEKLSSSLSQFIDSTQLQRSVPEYLWFVVAIGGIVSVILILRALVNYLISTLKELKEESMRHSTEIATLNETMKGVKDILFNYGEDIRELRTQKRRGQ